MIDPRANNDEKIVPPSPLPYVSRRALMRIPEPLQPPTKCTMCGCKVELVNHKVVYGREYSDWPYMYRCTNAKNCDTYVGVHPNTDIPLGTLADKDTREARKNNKNLFIELQRQNKWSRKEAYHWLSLQLNIPEEQCHWAMFNVEEAKKAGQLCANELYCMYT